MYHHSKKLMYTVRVDEPDVRFGQMLLEQFGGPNGELAAALQYTFQAHNTDDPSRRDLLFDIGTEELAHLEVIGTLARAHLAPLKKPSITEAAVAPMLTLVGGGGVGPFDSQGNPWTAAYLKISGQLEVDLRSNLAAEARAKITYERLLDLCNDRGTNDALQFLMTREIAHMKAFGAALESMNLDPFEIGKRDPSPEFVDSHVDSSTGDGELGRSEHPDWLADALNIEPNPVDPKQTVRTK